MIHLPFSPVYAAPVVGTIKNPTAYTTSVDGSGLFLLLNNILRLAGTVAALFVIFQLISAGYLYITAAGDPKKFEQAWAKIWQAGLGLIVVASAFVFAAVIGKITGINPLEPVLYGPN